jgi:hypothetical protein
MALTTFFEILMNNIGIFLFDMTQILISKKFEKEIFFESSVLAWIRSRIQIELKCWIRIESIRIHSPVVEDSTAVKYGVQS